MIKVLGAVLMIAVMASTAYGEVNGAREPQIFTAGAGNDSIMVTAISPQTLPSYVIAFTGTSAEFGVYFWGDWDDNGSYEWTSAAVQVPGSMTLPKVSQAQYRAADGLWHTGWKFVCAADDVAVIMGDK